MLKVQRDRKVSLKKPHEGKEKVNNKCRKLREGSLKEAESTAINRLESG